MKKKVLWTTMICMAAVALTACGQKNGSNTSSADSAKKTVTETQKTTTETTAEKTGMDSSTVKAENAEKSLPVKKGSVRYELTINDVAITSNEMVLYSDSAVVSLSERVSEDVTDGKYKGDYVKSGLEKGIKEIDISNTKDWLDGTTVTTATYTLKDIKSGSSFHITLAKDMAKRLGFKNNVITVKVPEME
ncbi:MAG: hypothetical protein DUD27_09675 [Lachnospiraceae bacterium]|nr:MAG: hypothetical protein DUD27_09675 [Lachnospiraceae bacterium]